MQEKKIGVEIANAREKAGLSQRQLAKVANISNAELSKIESGEREVPNPKTLRKISKYIDLNYNDMMYMIGLGMKVSPLNPFIKNYYSDLKGSELNDAWFNTNTAIKNNEVIIKSLETQVTDEKMSNEDKDVLLETIEDLKYQNNTNLEILKLIDSLRYEEERKNAKNKKIS